MYLDRASRLLVRHGEWPVLLVAAWLCVTVGATTRGG